jgi:hypothetical protein
MGNMSASCSSARTEEPTPEATASDTKLASPQKKRKSVTIGVSADDHTHDEEVR